MATAPANNLPLFYNGLQPLSSTEHATWKARNIDTAPWLVSQHAIPVTIDEFAAAQRFFPIVFTQGKDAVPIALMGMNEGINTFVDETGKLIDNVYVPAWVRRYPFMLARLRPDSDELSLCFDPTAEAIGPFEDGQPLFEDGKPSAATNAILEFCRQFEEAGQRTSAFMKELIELNILIDGEVSIQPEGSEQPFVYRGFQMVSEEKLRDLRGDQLRKMARSGMLPLLYAHLFSLQVMREIFGRQVQQGKGPRLGQPAPAVIEA